MKKFFYILSIIFFSTSLSCGDGDDRKTFQTRLELQDQSGNVKNEFSQTEPVTLVLYITNLTDSPQTLVVTSPQTYEFLVADSTGSQVLWHWSFGKGFPAVMVELQFSGGETKIYKEIWDQKDDAGTPVSVGNYIAQGFVWTLEEVRSQFSSDSIKSETETRSPQISFTIK